MKNLIQDVNAIASAIETAQSETHKVKMEDWNGFTFYDDTAKGETVYKALAKIIGIRDDKDNTKFKPAPVEVQRSVTLAALHWSRALKVSKAGLISPTPAQFLKTAMSKSLGMSLPHHFNIPKSGSRTWVNLDKDGVTPKGKKFFEVSTGKSADASIRTWGGCSQAVKSIVDGFRKGGIHKIEIRAGKGDNERLYKLTLNFKYAIEGSEMKRT